VGAGRGIVIADTREETTMPGADELPATLRRSPRGAQRTWIAAHDGAVETYGEGERAHRTAFAALKHSYERVGDRWAPKKHKGPSDPRAARGGRAAAEGQGETFGGVDFYGNTKAELLARARDLGVRGRSSMDKRELAAAIARVQARMTGG
jgi:hypothetical protein